MPKVFGHDLIAAIVAVIAIYAIGFLLYGVLFSDFWVAQMGYTEADFEGQGWKMALGPLMPILIVLGLAALFQASGVNTTNGHLRIGTVAWIGFTVPALLYNFAYGVGYPFSIVVMDGVHILLGILAASAILVWRK